MKYCYDQAEKRAPKKLIWGETGPRLVNNAVTRFNMEEAVSHHAAFCPINYWQYKRLPPPCR